MEVTAVIKFISPQLTIQTKLYTNGKTTIAVGLDGAESYILGPYMEGLSLPDMLQLVATDIRMDDRYKLDQRFSTKVK